MSALSRILARAKVHPHIAHTTILNADHFHTIRAPSARTFRDRLDAVALGEGDLVKVQEQNATEGLEVVEPAHATMMVNYWYLRNQSSLGEPFPAGRVRYPNMVEALTAAIAWWERAPALRGIAVRRAVFERQDPTSKSECETREPTAANMA